MCQPIAPVCFLFFLQSKLLNIITTSRKQQRSFIDSLRKHRQYSNPDLLQQLVKIYKLKEAGSSFSEDVFNLDTLPKEDSAGGLSACEVLHVVT